MEEQMPQSQNISGIQQSSCSQTVIGQVIDTDRQNQLPYNCIGCVFAGTKYGAGTLINQQSVLTSGHTFLKIHAQGRIKIVAPEWFDIQIQDDLTTFWRRIKVVDFKIPKEFVDNYIKMINYPEGSSERQQLWEKSTMYDYALLKLQQAVKMPQYPTICPNFNQQNLIVSISGFMQVVYRDRREKGFKQVVHSGPIIFRPTGGYYQIQTYNGQSGGPVFYFEQAQPQQQSNCKMVGIHKGYDAQMRCNSCVLITGDILASLNLWYQEMHKGIGTVRSPQVNKRQRKISNSFLSFEDKSKAKQIKLFSELRQPLIPTRQYRIIPCNDINKCIRGSGIWQGGSNIMALQTIRDFGQIWYIKQVKKDEYCIYSQHQKTIVYGLYINCYIFEYLEREKWEQNSRFRWKIQKRGQNNGRCIYLIRNAYNNDQILYKNNGDVVIPNQLDDGYYEWKEAERDLWYIQPVQNY